MIGAYSYGAADCQDLFLFWLKSCVSPVLKSEAPGPASVVV